MFNSLLRRALRPSARMLLLKVVALVAAVSMLLPSINPVTAADADEFGPLKKLSSATAASLGLSTSLWHIAFDNSGYAYIIGNNAKNKSRKIVKVDPKTGTKVAEVALTDPPPPAQPAPADGTPADSAPADAPAADAAPADNPPAATPPADVVNADVEIRDITFVPKFLAADGTTVLENILVAALKPAHKSNDIAYVKLTESGFDSAGFTFVSSTNDYRSNLGRDSVGYYGETLSYTKPQPAMIIAGVNDAYSGRRINIYAADKGFSNPQTQEGVSYAHPFGPGLAYVGYSGRVYPRIYTGKFDWNHRKRIWDSQVQKENYRDTKSDNYVKEPKRYRPYKSVSGSMHYGLYGARWTGFSDIAPLNGGATYVTVQAGFDAGMGAYDFLAPDADGNYTAIAGVKKRDGIFMYWNDFSSINSNMDGINGIDDPLSKGWQSQKIGDAGRDIMDIKVAPNGVVGVLKDDGVIFYDQKVDKAKISEVQAVRSDDGKVRPVAPNVRGSRLTFSAGAGKPSGLNVDQKTGEVTGTLDENEKGSFKVTVTGSGLTAMEVTYYYGPYTAPQDHRSNTTFYYKFRGKEYGGDLSKFWEEQYPKPAINISFPAANAVNSLPAGVSFEPGAGKLSGPLSEGEHSPLMVLADNPLSGKLQTVTVSITNYEDIVLRYSPEGAADYTEGMVLSASAFTSATYPKKSPLATLPAGQWKTTYPLDWKIADNAGLEGLRNYGPDIYGDFNTASGTYSVTLTATVSGPPALGADGIRAYDEFPLVYVITLRGLSDYPGGYDIPFGEFYTSAFPEGEYEAVGLPPGLGFTSNTLTGVPVKLGLYTATMTGSPKDYPAFTVVKTYNVYEKMFVPTNTMFVVKVGSSVDIRETFSPMRGVSALSFDKGWLKGYDGFTIDHNAATWSWGGGTNDSGGRGLILMELTATGFRLNPSADATTEVVWHLYTVGGRNGGDGCGGTPCALIAQDMVFNDAPIDLSIKPIPNFREYPSTASRFYYHAYGGTYRPIYIGYSANAPAEFGKYAPAFERTNFDKPVDQQPNYIFTYSRAARKDLSNVRPAAGVDPVETYDVQAKAYWNAVGFERTAKNKVFIYADPSVKAFTGVYSPGGGPVEDITPDLYGKFQLTHYQVLGTPGTQPNTDADNPLGIYPYGLTFTPGSGVFGGSIAAEVQPGVYSVALSAEADPVAGRRIPNMKVTYTFVVLPSFTPSWQILAQETTIGPPDFVADGVSFAVGESDLLAAGAGLPKGFTLNTDNGKVSGSPAEGVATGVYTPVVVVSRADAQVAATLTYTINLASFSIAPQLFQATIGSAVNVALVSEGAAQGLTYALEGAPNGLGADDAGAVTGVPAAELTQGFYTFTFKAYSGDVTYRNLYTALVFKGDLAVGPEQPSAATIDVAHTFSVPVTGWFTKAELSPWYATEPGIGLPLGLVFEQENPRLLGKVDRGVAEGLYTAYVLFTGAAVSDGAVVDKTVTAALTYTVTLTPSIRPLNRDVAIGAQITISPSPSKDGWTYSVNASDLVQPGLGLPKGLTLAADSGLITGVMPEEVALGAYTATVTVFDAEITHSALYTLMVRKPITLSAGVVFTTVGGNISLPAVFKGGPQTKYAVFAASDTIPPVNGAFAYPKGLTFDTDSGLLTGDVAADVQPGEYLFEVRLQGDSVQSPPGVYRDRALYTLFIGPLPSLEAKSLRASVGTSVSIAPPTQVFAKSYVAVPSEAITAGGAGIPKGLTFNTDSGILDGSLDAEVKPGGYTFSVTLVAPTLDPDNAATTSLLTSAVAYTIDVYTDASISALSKDATVGSVFTLSPSPSGYLWTYAVNNTDLVAAGAGLPKGLSLNTEDGVITGEVAAEVPLGVYNPVVTAEMAGASVSATYTILVRKPLTLAAKSAVASPGGALVGITPQVTDGPVASYEILATEATDTPAADAASSAYPKGLSFNTDTGVLDGNVAAEVLEGIYTFPVKVIGTSVENPAQDYTATALYTLIISKPRAIAEKSFDYATEAVGVKAADKTGFFTGFSANPSADEENNNVTGQATEPGSGMPKGFTVSKLNGDLSGRPADGITPGVYTFMLVGYGPTIDAQGAVVTQGVAATYRVTVPAWPTMQNQYADVVYQTDNTINPTPAPQPGWTYSHFGLLSNSNPSPGGDLVGLTLNTANGVLSGQGMNWTRPHDPRLIVVYNSYATHTATYYFMGIVPLGLGAKLTQFTPEQAGVNIPVSVSGGPASVYELIGVEGTEPDAGVWPKGLNINVGNGAVTGDLAAEVAEGVYTFGIKVKASSTETPPREHTATASYTLIISKPRAVDTVDTAVSIGAAVNLPVVKTGFFTSWAADPAPAAADDSKVTGTADAPGAGLPKGIVFNPADGSLSGEVAAAEGVYTFTVTGFGPSVNADGALVTESASAVYQLTVINAPVINTQAKDLTPQVAVTISPTLAAKDGWVYAVNTTDLVAPGAGLPKGLTLNTDTGVISGEVAEEVEIGIYTPTVTVSAAAIAASASAVYTLLVRKPLTLAAKAGGAAPGGALAEITPQVTDGPVASYELLATEATETAAEGAASSAYPKGLSFNTDTGVLGGDVAAEVLEGVYTFGVKVIGTSVENPAQVYTATALYTLVISKPRTVQTLEAAVSPGGALNTAVTATGLFTSWLAAPAPAAAEGKQTGTAAVAGEGLPKGLVFNLADGALSGNLAADAAVGVYTFTVTGFGPSVNAAGELVTDSASAIYKVTVVSTPTVTAQSKDLTPGVAATLSPAPAAGSGWAYAVNASDLVAPGAGLPKGLTLNPDTGVISGEVADEVQVGVYTPIITVSAAAINATASATYTLLVRKALALGVKVAEVSPGGALAALAPSVAGGPVASYELLATAATETAAADAASSAYPSGLNFNTDNGQLSGDVAAEVLEGVYAFPVKVVGTSVENPVQAYTATALYTLIVSKPRVVQALATAASPGAALNAAATSTGLFTGWSAAPAPAAAADGKVTGTAAVAGEGLPKGLVFNPADGALSGNLAADLAQGVYTFTVFASGPTANAAKDAAEVATASAVYQITVIHVPTVSPQAKDVTPQVAATISPAPAASQGWVYAVNTTDLVAPGAGLPKGLELNTDTGVISGEVAAEVSEGIYTPTVTASAAAITASASAVYTILVRKPLTLGVKVAEVSPGGALAALAPSVAGGPVASYELLATEATETAAEGVASSAYPKGLTFNTDTGVLGGNAAAEVLEGVYAFPVKVVGTSVENPTQAYTATALYTLIVSKPRVVQVLATAASPGAALDAAATSTGLFTGWSAAPAPAVAADGKVTGTVAVAGAGLPKGVVFNLADGALSGNVAADAGLGVYTFTVFASGPAANAAKDAVTPATASAVYLITVIAPPQISTLKTDVTVAAAATINPAPAASDGWAYAVNAKDLVAPGAGLPKGLTLDAANGKIVGQVAAEAALGVYTPTVTVSAAAIAASASAVYTLLVRADLTLAPKVFGVAPEGSLTGITPQVTGGPVKAYELLATGATTPAAADAATAAYPQGLELNTDTGVISGKVAAEVSEGVYTFGVKVLGTSVNDPAAVYSATALYTVTVLKAIKVKAAAYTVAAKQKVTLSPTYEGTPTAWAAPAAIDAPGAGLPKGLLLNVDSGLISGVAAADAGVYTVLLTAKGQTYDAAGVLVDAVASETVLITVLPSAAVSALTRTVAIDEQVTLTPRPTAEAGWSYTAVGLPDGWGIDADTGVVTGLVTEAVQFTVKVTDTGVTEGALPSAEAIYSLIPVAKVDFEEDDAALLATVGERIDLPLEYVGAPTSISFVGVKGTTPGGGVYPANLTVDNNGHLGGVIAAAVKPGEYVFTVRAAGVPENNTDIIVITISVTTDPAAQNPDKPADGADGADGAGGGDSGNNPAGNNPAGDGSGNGSGNDSGNGSGENSGDSDSKPSATPGEPATVPPPADLPAAAGGFKVNAPLGTEPGNNVVPSALRIDPNDGSLKGEIADEVKPGEYTFPVTYTDADGSVKTTSYTVTVDPKPNAVATPGSDAEVPAPSDAPAGAKGFGFGPGVSYGTSPAPGVVPFMLLLAEDGSMKGELADNVKPGKYTFPVTYTDADGSVKTTSYTVEVKPKDDDSADKSVVTPGKSVSTPAPTNLPAGANGFKVNAPLGTEPGNNVVPSALRIDPNDGSLKGEIADNVKPGKYTFPVTYTDADGSVKTTSYTVTVAPKDESTDKPSATPGEPATVPAPSDLPAGAGGFKVNAPLGTEPGNNVVPSALRIDPNDGSLKGEIADNVKPGKYTFPVTFTDSDGSVKTTSYTVTVDPKPNAVVTPGGPATVPAPADAPAGASNYGFGPGVSYGTSPAPGVVPFMLFLAEDGSMKGEIADNVKPGKYSFPVVYTDADGNVKTTSYTVEVQPKGGANSGSGSDSDSDKANKTSLTPGSPATVPAPTDLPAGAGGFRVDAPLGTEPGVGAIPSALRIDPNDGSMKGVLADNVKPGKYTFPVVYTDADGNVKMTSYTVTVDPKPNAVVTPGGDATVPAPSDLPAGAEGFGFGSGVSYGTSPAPGVVPFMLFLAEDGSMKGELADNVKPGKYTFPVTYTDADGNVKTTSYTVEVQPKGGADNGSGSGSGDGSDSDSGSDKANKASLTPGSPATVPAPSDLPAGAGGFKLDAPLGTEPGNNVVPSALRIDPNDGSLKGVLADNVKPGKYTFPVVYTDADGNVKTTNYTVTVDPKPNAVVTPGGPATVPAPADAPEGAKGYGFGPGVSYGTSPAPGVVPFMLFLAEDGSMKGELADNVKPGKYTFPVTYTDADGNVKTTSYTVEVQPKGGKSADGDPSNKTSVTPGKPATVPAPADLPAGAGGFKLDAPLGTEPGNNVVPSALRIDPNDGSLKGVLADNVKPGKYTFPVVYTDADGNVKTTNYTVTVAPKGGSGSGNDSDTANKASVTPGSPATVPAPSDLPAGAGGFKLDAPLGTEPGNNVVPSALRIDPNDGSMKGEIADNVKPGKYTFPVVYTDADGNVKTTNYTVTVDPKPNAVVTPGGPATVPAPADLPAGAEGFGFGPGVSYGTSPAPGVVPFMLFLAEDGSMKGEIADNVKPGKYTFPVTYTDADGNVKTTSYTVEVQPKGGSGNGSGDGFDKGSDDGSDPANKASLTPGKSATVPAPSDLPAGAGGFKLDAPLGTEPGENVVPSALRIDPNDGSLKGELADNVKPGKYTFPVVYTDAAGNVVTTNYTVTVSPRWGGFVPATTFDTVITQYQSTMVAGYPGAVKYSFAPGAAYGAQPGLDAVPSVMFLNENDGSLEGIVQGATGVYSFLVDVTKADGSKDKVLYLITVVPSVELVVEAVITQNQPARVAGLPGAVSYSFAPGAAYGDEPGTNVVPSVLFLYQNDGHLQGEVKGAVGRYVFPVDVTRANGRITQVIYRITVARRTDS